MIFFININKKMYYIFNYNWINTLYTYYFWHIINSIIIPALIIIYFFNSKPKTKVKQTTLKTTTGTLYSTIYSSLSVNNSIYLTSIQQDGIYAFIYHIFRGYYDYFYDPINGFCLFIALLQIHEYNDLRTIIPLSIFATIYTLNHVYNNTLLLITQYKLNHEQYYVTRNGEILKVYRKDILRGDILKLISSEVPADIVLLNGSCLVQELELTGENIVVSKSEIQPTKLTNEIIINHHKNTGKIHDFIYTSNNILFSGTKIIDNINDSTGVVIETGNDCAIYKINLENIQKYSKLQTKLYNISLFNLYLLLSLTCISSIFVSSVYDVNLFVIFRKLLMLYNSIIPLSLQVFFNTASNIISKHISKKINVNINTNGIHSYQYNPKYIVSDKTGTITTNKVKLHQVCINELNLLNALSILAINETRIHSTTNEYLQNDILDYHIVMWLKLQGYELIYNSNTIFRVIDHNLNKTIACKKNNFKSFDYNTGMKSVIFNYNNVEYNSVQGTPESINNTIINNNDVPTNAYERIICGKNITTNTVYTYIFYDYLVPDIYSCVHDILKNKDFTLLTGDKLSSAKYIANKLKLTTVEYNINTKYKYNDCILINAKEFDNEIFNTTIFPMLLQYTNCRIIYRARPDIKQKYISLLPGETLMIGDGSNDLSAIMNAHIGIAVDHETNVNVKNSSKIIVKSWKSVNDFLNIRKQYTSIITKISQWIILKHLSSSFSLITMFILSNFSELKDPSNPYLVTGLNGFLFLNMLLYLHYTSKIERKIKFRYIIILGCLLGIINSVIVFSNYNYSIGIYYLFLLQISELLVYLWII